MNKSMCEAPASSLMLEVEVHETLFPVIVLSKMKVQQSIAVFNDNMHYEDCYPTLNTLQAATVFGRSQELKHRCSRRKCWSIALHICVL